MKQCTEVGRNAAVNLPNCLAYALRYWKAHPHYRLYYNSNHVVNLPVAVGEKCAPTFLPAEAFGFGYFAGAFEGLLDEEEQALLQEYFHSPNPFKQYE
jgi:hypothetical protein